MADDFVADTDGQRDLTPAAVDAVYIRAANTAAFDLDVDIMVTELFGCELDWKSVRCWRKERRPSQCELTSCFLNSVHFFWSDIMKPSNLSG